MKKGRQQADQESEEEKGSDGNEATAMKSRRQAPKRSHSALGGAKKKAEDFKIAKSKHNR